MIMNVPINEDRFVASDLVCLVYQSLGNTAAEKIFKVAITTRS